MDIIGDISAWLTPAIIIGLFLWLRGDIHGLEKRVDKRIDGLEERFENTVQGLEERFKERFDGLDRRIDGLDRRIDGLDRRIDGLDDRLRAVEAGQAEIKGQLAFVRDYVLGRNLQAPEATAEPAPGD